MHPDIVGVYYPFYDYSENVLKLFKISETPYKLFSFELKTELNYRNLREYYFQAVSNSSWSNEGYLVALKIDNSIYDELRRLNNSFGIGIIKLNPKNIFQSEILFSAREHKNLDWDGGSDSVGYYISNGMIQKVQWAKEPNNERSKLAFYDETGNEIKVNRGKSYIALNYANQATFQ